MAMPPTDAPPMVHRDTFLGQISQSRVNEYVLVVDDEERLIGIVPVREINRRLQSGNRFERSRWAAMPIGALSNLSFSDTGAQGISAAERSVACSAIVEGESLLGLGVDGDLFLSWRRLESMFTAALSDPLTGLMNRLAYERRLREEWSRSTRTGTSIGVVVVDLDGFKKVNDTHGHTVGDELLIQVARQLEFAMRSYDVVARFGGDEFVALCLGCAPGDIQIPMFRLLQNVAAIKLKHDGHVIGVGASVGAAVRHGSFDANNAEDLFVAADDCLYEAKRSGSPAWCTEFGLHPEIEPRPVECSEIAADNSHPATSGN